MGEIGQLSKIKQLAVQSNWSWFMAYGYFINKYYDSNEVKII